MVRKEIVVGDARAIVTSGYTSEDQGNIVDVFKAIKSVCPMASDQVPAAVIYAANGGEPVKTYDPNTREKQFVYDFALIGKWGHQQMLDYLDLLEKHMGLVQYATLSSALSELQLEGELRRYIVANL